MVPPGRNDEKDKESLELQDAKTPEARGADEPDAAAEDRALPGDTATHDPERPTDVSGEQPSSVDAEQEHDRIAEEQDGVEEEQDRIKEEYDHIAEERDRTEKEYDHHAEEIARDPLAEVENPRLSEPDAAVAADGSKQNQTVTAAGPPPPPLPPPSARSRGGFWTALLGALVGAALGAGAVWYMLERMPREPDPALTAALDQQAGEISTQADRVSAIEGEVSTLEETVGANDLSAAVDTLRTESEARMADLDKTVAGLGDRLDAVEGRLGDTAPRLDKADARLAALEARPIADPETANQVLRSEVADMRGEVEKATEDARAQVETMRNELSDAADATQQKIEAAEQRAADLEAEAQKQAAAAESRTALAQIETALDSGKPYAGPLAVLGQNTPEALSARAETGVPTLGELRESFPDAARAALKASRVEATEGEPGERFLAFLRTQTRARSLTPQEGDAPDAVLSRADAGLAAGNLQAALSELAALPADGHAAMQDWIDNAEARVAAVEAAGTLSQDMN